MESIQFWIVMDCQTLIQQCRVDKSMQ